MMTRIRRVMVGVIFLLSMINASVGLAAKGDGQGKGPKLNFAGSKRKHGAEAVKAIGARLPDVAKHHRMKPERLKAMIEKDHDLWVTDDSELLYICEGLKCDEHDHAVEAAEATGGRMAVIPHSMRRILSPRPFCSTAGPTPKKPSSWISMVIGSTTHHGRTVAICRWAATTAISTQRRA